MSNIINPVAERALDMALRSGVDAPTDAVIARAKAFEKYINQDRPSLDEFEEVIKAAKNLAEVLSFKSSPYSQSELELVEAVKKVRNDL